MPMAAASTGTRKFDLRALSHSSSAMIAAPMATPMAIIVHGSLPPNMPLATDAISVACGARSEEHTSELQSLMRISYAVFCLKKKKNDRKKKREISKAKISYKKEHYT